MRLTRIKKGRLKPHVQVHGRNFRLHGRRMAGSVRVLLLRGNHRSPAGSNPLPHCRSDLRKEEPQEMERSVFGITDRWQTAITLTENTRGLKKLVREWNNSFGEDENHNVYIISGSKGYRLTRDMTEIMQSIEKEERLARIRFSQAHKRRKRARDFFSKNERLPL